MAKGFEIYCKRAINVFVLAFGVNSVYKVDKVRNGSYNVVASASLFASNHGLSVTKRNN